MSSDPPRASRAAARAAGRWMAPDEALAAATRMARSLDRAAVRRLLPDAYAVSLHRLSDRELASRLGQALVSGHAAESDETPEVDPEWLNVSGLGHELALITSERLQPGLDLFVIEDLAMARKVADLLLGDDIARQFLLDYTKAPESERDRKTNSATAEEALGATCAELLFDRDVNLFTPRKAVAGGTPAPINIAPRPPTDAKEAETDHWIEIVLKDEDGQPIPDEPYQITLPGGEVRKGTLDGAGKARIDGLKNGGSAQVAFPEIDGREWRLA